MKQNDGFLKEAIFLFEQVERLNVSIFKRKKTTLIAVVVFICDFAQIFLCIYNTHDLRGEAVDRSTSSIRTPPPTKKLCPY